MSDSRSTTSTTTSWRRAGIVAATVAAFVLGSSVTVLAQSGREDLYDDETTTTQRSQDTPDVGELSDDQVAELGGEQAAAEELANTAATDGTFNSFRGVYAPRSSQCVLFDTRSTSKLAANSTTTFSLTDPTSQGGQSGCTVPSSALSAHVNIIAINPDGGGNLKVYGASLTTEPAGGIVNYNDLTPNLNNANAFIMDYDASGWKVKVNGASVHARAVIMGYFYDGGSSYAAARHDHSVVQATGGTLHVDQTTPQTVRTVNMAIQDECSPFLVETHNALVTISGYAYPHTGASAADIELWVNGSEETAARIEFADEDLNGTNQIPLSKTFLVDDLSSGTHTFASRAHLETAGSAAVDIDADIVVEHRGWDCSIIIFP